MSTAQAATKPEAAKTPKAEYEEAITAQLHEASAKVISEKVLDRLLSAKVPTALSDLNKQIGEASSRQDFDKIIELTKQISDIRSANKHNKTDIAQLRDKYKFEDVISIYSAEFENVAYSLALDVLKQAHISIRNAAPAKRAKAGTGTDEGRRASAAAKEAHIAGPDGQTFVVPFHKGPPTLKGLGELLKALGFNVEETPKGPKTEETIKPKEGGEMLVTRRNIVDAIKSGLYKGFTVTKDETDEQKPA